MMRAHQPGSQPIDIPETIPNPAVPQPVPVPSPAPKQPVKVPAPQNDTRTFAPRIAPPSGGSNTRRLAGSSRAGLPAANTSRLLSPAALSEGVFRKAGLLR
jgi:hypothetical protein